MLATLCLDPMCLDCKSRDEPMMCVEAAKKQELVARDSKGTNRWMDLRCIGVVKWNVGGHGSGKACREC